MGNSVFIFFRKTYKIFSAIIFVVFFFFVYNTYLVDRSIINLKIALNGLAQAQTIGDFQKIKPLLKVAILQETAKGSVSPKLLRALENADNVSGTAEDIAQVEDIKFFLKQAIESKEKERGAALTFIDNFNSNIFKPEIKVQEEKLQARAGSLLAKAGSVTDTKTQQKLYFDAGNVYLQLSDLQRAEEAFTKAINISPKTEIALRSRFNLALAYKNAGETEKAIAYFIELGKELDADIELATTSEYEIADTLYKKGDYLAARDKYAQLANESPNFEAKALALLQVGSISMYKLNDYKAALKLFHEYALTQAGNISYLNLKDFEGAVKYFAELEEKAEKSELSKHVREFSYEYMVKDFRRRGYVLLKGKEYSSARESFKKAIEISPRDGRSIIGEALGLYWEGKKQEAILRAFEAIGAKSDDEFIIINAMFIYENSGNIDTAIKSGEDFMAQKKSVIKRAEFFYNLGYAYVLKGKYDKASVNFAKAIRIDDDFVFAYNNLGCVLWAERNYSEAIKKFIEATHRKPDYADAFYNLGVAYYNLNRLEEAMAAFESTLDIDPNFAEAKKYLSELKKLLKY